MYIIEIVNMLKTKPKPHLFHVGIAFTYHRKLNCALNRMLINHALGLV